MVEFIKHTLGLCGEPHINIFHIILGTPAISYLLYKIKKIKCKYQKNKRNAY
jgi:hypothetical protein